MLAYGDVWLRVRENVRGCVCMRVHAPMFVCDCVWLCLCMCLFDCVCLCAFAYGCVLVQMFVCECA